MNRDLLLRRFDHPLMVDGSDSPAPDVILADSAWLRSLTLSLVHDADLADDLGQEVLLAELSRPTDQSGGSSRSWLGRVARNIAICLMRRESRRRHTERSAAREGSMPDTSDLAAQAELQRLAVGALLALPETYRSALLMRFMKGLSSREIARRSSIPVETIRTRIKRGLAMLRAKLDQEHGGRRAWLAPIGVPAIWRHSTFALWGVALMKLKTKLVTAAGMILVGLLGIWFIAAPSASPAGVPERVAEGMTVRSVDPEDARLPDPAPLRSPVDSNAAGAETTATLLVHVTWEDNGLPAPHVGVLVHTVLSEAWVIQFKGLGRVASTDEDGNVDFESLEPGQLWVKIDRMNATWKIDIAEGVQETLEIEVPRQMDVRGIVVDPSGVGVAGAEVLVTRPGVAPQWLHSVMKTASDGTFFLRSLGRNLVAARAEGYGTSDLVRVRPGDAVDGQAEVRLVLPEAPAGLLGTVYDPEGRPVEGALVSVGRARPGGNAPPQVLLETDPEGGFHARHLKPGRYAVFVYDRGLAPWTGTVDCLPRVTAELGVQLHVGGDLYGTVTDGEGRPLQEVRIEFPDLGWAHTSMAFTDETGIYRFEDLPAGDITVTATSAQLDKQVHTWVMVEGQDQRRDIILNTGPQIRGVLLDPEGHPLQGCWIIQDQDAIRGPGMYRFALSDDRGRFTLANCEEGRLYSVRVHGGEANLPTLHVFQNVAPGPEERTFRLPAGSMPSARIVGKVLGPEGRTVAGASLRLEQDGVDVSPNNSLDARGNPIADLAPTHFTMGPVDERGVFEIGPLPPGEYEVWARHPDYPAVEFGALTLLPGEIHQLPDRRFRSGAKLDVTLLQGTLDQLYELRVVLQDLEGKPVGRGTVRDQQVTFPVLKPGSYKLSVTGPNIETQLLPIELTAKETLAVEITSR